MHHRINNFRPNRLFFLGRVLPPIFPHALRTHTRASHTYRLVLKLAGLSLACILHVSSHLRIVFNARLPLLTSRASPPLHVLVLSKSFTIHLAPYTSQYKLYTTPPLHSLFFFNTWRTSSISESDSSSCCEGM